MTILKKNSKTKIAICILVILVSSIMFIAIIFSFANATVKFPDSNIIGLGNNKFEYNSTIGLISDQQETKPDDLESSQAQLSNYSVRDVSTLIMDIIKRREYEARLAEETAIRIENAHIDAVEAKIADFKNRFAIPEGGVDINGRMRKADFIALGTYKINKYLEGTPLAGKGEVFATVSGEKGVDPRLSAAISNTESSKGLYCFLPFNAGGGGQRSGTSGEEAINEHIDGLATKYHYSVAYEVAQKYCPPNGINGANNTNREILKITNE